MKAMRNVLSSFVLAAALLQVAGCSAPPVNTEQMLSDKDVTNKVRLAIVSDPLTKNSPIEVETIRGIVHLRGSVGSKEALDRAAQLARGASGAMGVQNELIVVVTVPK